MPKQKTKEVKQWITIKGNHIPVFEGESVDDAAKKFMKHEGAGKKPTSRREKLEERQQKYNEMEDVLGEPFDPDLVREIEKDWNAFYKDPKKYKGTVVPELVNHYIDQHPITKGAYDKAYRKAHKEDKTEQVKKSKKSVDIEEGSFEAELEEHSDPEYKNVTKGVKTDRQLARENIARRVANGEYTYEVGNTPDELTERLKKNGLELDNADRADLRSAAFNDEKVTMHDKDGNEYTGTYNRYRDGGREIVNIKQTKTNTPKQDKTKQVTEAIKARTDSKKTVGVTTKEQALKDIKNMKMSKYDRDEISYLYKDTGGAWVHADAMERAIEKPLSGKKTSTEKSLRRNFDNMLRDWEDVRDTVDSDEARKWLDKEISQYKKRFEDNMKKWKDNK